MAECTNRTKPKKRKKVRELKLPFRFIKSLDLRTNIKVYEFGGSNNFSLSMYVKKRKANIKINLINTNFAFGLYLRTKFFESLSGVVNHPYNG